MNLQTHATVGNGAQIPYALILSEHHSYIWEVWMMQNVYGRLFVCVI